MRHLPNLLTIARIVLGVAIAGLVLGVSEPLWGPATGCLILAALTDRLDGGLARRLGAVTRLGTLLDPLADKVLVVAGLGSLVAAGIVTEFHALAVAVIFAREILVSGARFLLAPTRDALPVTRLARWKTALQMTAVGSLFAGAAWPWIVPLTPGLILLWCAAALTAWTGTRYGRTMYDQLTKGKAAP